MQIKVPEGHKLIASEELRGQALAWAVCAVYQMNAVIFDGVVHVEATPGQWRPFDAQAMMRSLVVGHTPAVLVPDEIADR